MSYLRLNFPDVSITPKLHILEDHMVTFVSKWHAGCGFYGEQGGESIHAIFNRKKSRYSGIKNDCDRLSYLMKEYLSSTNPAARAIRDTHKKKSRLNMKRKNNEN